MVSEFGVVFGMAFYNCKLIKNASMFCYFYGFINAFGVFFGLTFIFSQWLPTYLNAIKQIIYLPHTGNLSLFNILFCITI